MNAKTVVPNLVNNIVESAVKPTIEDATKQVAPISRDLLKMLYWSDTTPPPPESSISKKQTNYLNQDSQALSEARKKHSEILGGKSDTQAQPPTNLENLNVKPSQQTNNNTLVMEHHRKAEQLGVNRQDEEEMKKRKIEQDEEEKKLADEKARLASLESPIEVQGKQPTGFGGKRKRAGVKMQKPPKTGENKIGQGGRE